MCWCPTNGETFASSNSDGSLRVWDLREQGPTLTIRAHDQEVLCCDWNKYEDFSLVTGGVDRTVRVWDIRQPQVPVRVMIGHGYAVKRVICSPHNGNLVASCSYDMSVCYWDTKVQGKPLLLLFLPFKRRLNFFFLCFNVQGSPWCKGGATTPSSRQVWT